MSTMDTWYVSCPDNDLEWNGEATCASDACEFASEHWYAQGAWAGDKMPEHLEVFVRRNDEATRKYRVCIDWEPTFYAMELEP